MKLYLVQHGMAASKEVDPERSLTEQGKTDVEGIAAMLARAGIGVTHLIHSGKRRAQQTAAIIAAAIAPDVEVGVSEQIGPLDDPARFDWQGTSGGEDTMLVGHLPFMAKLAAFLVTGDAGQLLVAYQPGSVLCLESNEDGSWQIDWMLRPELLA